MTRITLNNLGGTRVLGAAEQRAIAGGLSFWPGRLPYRCYWVRDWRYRRYRRICRPIFTHWGRRSTGFSAASAMDDA